jgi:Tol biopolymer transport system component
VGTASEPANFNTVALSPDGTRAAVSRAVALGGSGDLWMHVFARGTSTRFTSDPTNEYMAVWSPDGNRIAFSSSRDQYYNLYLKAASGAGNESELLKSSEHKYAYDWSSDGRFLLYGVTDPKSLKLTLWTVPLSGDPKPASYLNTQFNQHQAQFSPDGRWIAYSSDETGRNEIYVQPFPTASGGKWPVSTEGGTQPRWRRDNGKELFYVSADSRLMAVDVSTTTVSGSPVFHAGVPKALFPAPIFGGGAVTVQYRYDVTSDGKRFLINTVAGAATPASASPITVVLNWTAGLKK